MNYGGFWHENTMERFSAICDDNGIDLIPLDGVLFGDLRSCPAGREVRDLLMSNIRIIHGDCMTSMKAMPDKAYELAIVDPPYGIGVNHSMGRRAGQKASPFAPCRWDIAPPDKGYFDELFRVSMNQIIWGANHFMDSIGKRSPCWVVWDKLFSEDVTFASAELAFTSFDSVTKRIALSSLRANGIHPTQKPVALYQWLLKNYAKPGDKILDTHGGSCSIAIACDIMGFDADIWEIDADYYRAAVERFERHQRQASLFQPNETKHRMISEQEALL